MSISSTFTSEFFVRILAPKPKRNWKKLPKRTFVRIFRAYDVDEIDTWEECPTFQSHCNHRGLVVASTEERLDRGKIVRFYISTLWLNSFSPLHTLNDYFVRVRDKILLYQLFLLSQRLRASAGKSFYLFNMFFQTMIDPSPGTIQSDFTKL